MLIFKGFLYQGEYPNQEKVSQTRPKNYVGNFLDIRVIGDSLIGENLLNSLKRFENHRKAF